MVKWMMLPGPPRVLHHLLLLLLCHFKMHISKCWRWQRRWRRDSFCNATRFALVLDHCVCKQFSTYLNSYKGYLPYPTKQFKCDTISNGAHEWVNGWMDAWVVRVFMYYSITLIRKRALSLANDFHIKWTSENGPSVHIFCVYVCVILLKFRLIQFQLQFRMYCYRIVSAMFLCLCMCRCVCACHAICHPTQKLFLSIRL